MEAFEALKIMGYRMLDNGLMAKPAANFLLQYNLEDNILQSIIRGVDGKLYPNSSIKIGDGRGFDVQINGNNITIDSIASAESMLLYHLPRGDRNACFGFLFTQ